MDTRSGCFITRAWLGSQGDGRVQMNIAEIKEEDKMSARLNLTMASSGSVRDKYLCHICEKTFESKQACMQHTKSHYQEQFEASPKLQSSQDGGTAESNMPTSTTAEKDSKSEVSQPTDGVPSLKNFSDEEIFAKLLERNYVFVCKCGIIFLDQALFYLHRRTHSAKNPYECSFCGHVAPNWYDFMSHFYVHSNSKDK